jgi:circadian clock protein KaiC
VVKKRTGRHENTLREFSINHRGLDIGETLDQYQGILRGVPQILGAGPSGDQQL